MEPTALGAEVWVQGREPIVHETSERLGDPFWREANIERRGEAEVPVRRRGIAADERHRVGFRFELTRHVHPRCSPEDPAHPPPVRKVVADLLGITWTTPHRTAEGVDEVADRRVVLQE